MPEIKKVFLRGKMNKDLDERLIPDGEYRDAKNIQIASTENDDAGTVQNILGNKVVFDTGMGGSCVGVIENTETDKIYIFIKGTSVNGIVQYDISEPDNPIKKPVILDARSTGGVLNFSGKKITGLTILDNYLIFTDNESEPKIINLDDTLTTGFFNSDNNTSLYNYTSRIGGNPFEEKDITLITKKPESAPDVQIKVSAATATSNPIFEDKFVRFAYRFKFTNSQRSPISPFTDPVFLPNATNSYDIDEGYNNQMINNIEEAKLFNFDTSYNLLQGIEIIYKESNNTNIYLYDSLTKQEAITANTGSGYDINKTVKKSIIPDNQLFRAYDNVPYRAKAVDVVGNRIVFGNYTDGIDVNDYNLQFNTIQLIDRGTLAAENTREFFKPGETSATSGLILGSNTSLKDTRTVKAGREYEVGVVFEDEYGRQTPVITAPGGSKSGTLKVLFDTGNDTGKKFEITLAGTKNDLPSDRIKKYKYYIKPSSNKFDNIIVETVKNDKEDSGTCWLVVPSYEINKVKEGQYMMLKKSLNTDVILPYSSPDDFKFKILDISGEKPENIDSPKTFDGKFFIKIKKTAQITSNIFSNQGIAGNDGNIPDGEFKNTAVPSGALFIGQYVVPDYDADRHVEYWFKDGEIYEVERDSSSALVPSAANTFNVNVNSGLNFNQTKGGVSGYAELTDNANKSNWTGSYTDSTGIVDKIFVKVAGADSASDFFIEYSGQNPGNNVSANSSPAVFETIPENEVLDVYYEASKSFDINDWGSVQVISWHNAYIMDNGVESSVIHDDFNEDRINAGVKVSTTISGDYKQRNQKSSLIYSGIYNEENGVNRLNEFNTALKITKELNPEYGSIQKLHTRDTDIIALCEDKILRVLANKDALFNADGNVNLTATENVLGQAIAYNGDYGISKNPESFANYGYRSYFTDKARGVVLRLSKDGLTIISEDGMGKFFRDNLLNGTNSSIIGSYDIHSDQYILTLNNYGSSFSYNEKVKGWVSKLTFLPEVGVSINGKYYTCYYGKLYQHHESGEERNTFYGAHDNSGIKLIFNQEPSTIKNFKNLSYEGTTSWSVDSSGIVTDQQEGEIIEFKEKEGKYFGLISGIETELDSIPESELDSRLKDFSIQGLGNISSHSGTLTFGCANAGLSINAGTVGDPVTGTITSGTIQSISPSTYQTGTNPYTATILAPSGFDNSGSTITCSASAGATAGVFGCLNANLQIANGIVGATVSGTVDLGTIASYSPTTYAAGTQPYTAVINVPSGYSNSGTISCTNTAAGSTASCAFSLTAGSSYSSGNYTLTGNFSGTDYTNSDTVTLSLDPGNGNIGIGSAGSSSSVNTTKSALAGELTIYTNQSVTVTATITNGLCSGESTTAQAPQSATVVINGSGTAMVGSNVTLTASTTGTVTSYQWYKDSSSGFTPGSGNLISGATSPTLVVTETSAGTEYYIVKINGTTDSAEHAIVWSAWTALNNLKYQSGTSENPLACTSTNTLNIFANGSFTAATQFAVNNQGSTTNFQQGTYSDGSNKRFINSSGVPSASSVCTGGNQGIRASKCNDSNADKYFNVDVGNNAALSNGNVISFTEQQFSNDYWYVENAAYSGTSFDAEPTLANTHTNCTLMLTPVIDVTSSASTSFIYSAGSLITRTLSLTMSNVPQGAAISYQWQGGTATNNLSDISGANSASLDVNFNTVSNSAGQPTYYNCNVTFADGSTSKTIDDTTNAIIVWNNFTTYTNLNYINGGSSSAPSVSACTNTSSQITLYGNDANLANVTQFYGNINGSASPAVTVGTYSDGNKRAYVLGGGAVASSWQECTTFAITGSTSSSSYATEILTAQETGFSGDTFTWTANSAQVQSGIDNTYAASVATTFSGNVTYGCTVSGGTASNQNDTHIINWSIPSQKVQARLCPNGSNLDILLTNADGYSVGNVINLTGSGLTTGCYEITGSFSGNQQYSALVSGSYPFAPSSSCCDCTNCSVSISRSGDATVVVNTNVTLTAASSGFTATNYAWYSKTSPSASYSNTPIQTGGSNQLQNQSSGSAGSIYYKVVATATGVSREAEITQSWFANNPVERFYTAQSFQSNCTDDDEVITVRYTSVSALSSGTVFELGSTVVTCYKITGSGSGDSTMDVIQTFHNSCTACQNANQVDCSFSLTTSGNYNSSNGTATVIGTFGSGHTGTVSVGFGVSSGTVSPTSATKAQLISGVTLTLSPAVTLTGTISSSDACTGDTATVTIPQSTCNSVSAYYTNANPATNTSAANDLCGNGTAKALYINGTNLGNTTQVYTQSGCGTLMSGTRYYSTDNSTYYIWNGYSLAGPYNLNCP